MKYVLSLVFLFSLIIGLSSCECESTSQFKPNYTAGDWWQINGGFSKFNTNGIPPVKQPSYSKPKFSVGFRFQDESWKYLFFCNGLSVNNSGQTDWISGNTVYKSDMNKKPKTVFYNILKDKIKVQGNGSHCTGSCIVMKMDPSSARATWDSDYCRVNVDIKFFHIPVNYGSFWLCGDCNN